MVTLSLSLDPKKEQYEAILNVLAELPLASTLDISGIMQTDVHALYRELWELDGKGYLNSTRLGCTRKRSIRWYVTDMGLAEIGQLGVTWHEEAHRCWLLDKIPLVEWFYRLVSDIKSLGKMQAFRWIDGLSFDAAARFEYGWVAIFWSGFLQSEFLIEDRILRFSRDVMTLNSLGESAWPGMFCFVVSDEWQRELVFQVARRHRLDDMVSVWCISDGVRSGVEEPLTSRGWIYQPVYTRSIGSWPWRKRVESSLWSNNGGMGLNRVFDVVVQFPGISSKLCALMTGVEDLSGSIDHYLRILLAGGFIDRTWSKEGYRYHVMPRGLDRLIRRDRVKYSDYKSRAQASSWIKMPRLREHEDGVMSILSQFRASGAPVASGWRSWEHLGGSGGIAPDGLVYLRQSPYGPGWHYLEYERRARGEYKANRKLIGYSSDRRQNNWPVLVVCWADSAERAFHEVGREMRVRMLTTTVERLAEHGPMNNVHCWSSYGHSVIIG